MNRDKIIRNFIIGTFVALYLAVSIVSTLHVITFFELTNPHWLAVCLAITFEIGTAASLAAIIILDKTSKSLVWFLFILLTLICMMGNMYFSYMNSHDYMGWMELFSLNEEEVIFQKRILAIISGAILPIVALGFIKSLVDYIRPSTSEEIKPIIESTNTEILKVQQTKKPDTSIYVKPATIENINEEELLKVTNIKSDSGILESVATNSTENLIDKINELESEQIDSNKKFSPPLINN